MINCDKIMKHSLLLTFYLIVVSIVLIACKGKQFQSTDPVSQLYAYAVNSLHNGQQNEAEVSLKKCINQSKTTQAHSLPDTVQMIFPQAMVQLLNTYQSEGSPELCVAYFDSLRSFVDAPQNKNTLLVRHFRRDVYIVSAYALSRTEQTLQAAQLMDKALKLPLYRATPDRLFRDNAYAAAVYFCEPTYHNQIEHYSLKALAEADKSHNKGGAGWVASMLGSWYSRSGQMRKAVDMFNRGYDYSKELNDTLGMVNARYYLADYMLKWGLAAEADKYAKEAVVMINNSLNFNPQVATQIFIVKARALVALERNREAMRYVDMANRLCLKLPYNSGASDLDVLTGKMGVRGNAPQTPAYQQAEKSLQRVSHHGTPLIKCYAWYELANAHLHNNSYAQAEVELDSLYRTLQVLPKSILASKAYNMALNHYVNTNNNAKILLYSKALSGLNTDSVYERTLRSLAQTLVDVNMQSQQEVYKENIEAMQHRAFWTYLVCAILFIIAVSVVGWGVWRYRRQQQRQKELQQQLADVKQRLQYAATNHDVLERKLRDVEQREEEKVKDGVQLFDILRSKGEVRFREYFERAYPYFIKRLRTAVPDVTRKEELFCILMALGCSNEEIMNMFSIARQSVYMAKYRIRKKTQLAEGDSLEAYMTSMLTE